MARVRWGWTFGLSLIGVFAILIAPAALLSQQATRIIRFVPDKTVESVRQGKCWTGSIAVARPDAWRCMIGNEIADPCFSRADGKFVVCGTNPARGDPGFGLELTEPLPKPDLPVQSSGSESMGGWLLELADGTLCRPVTGASGDIDGKAANYYCENGQPGKEIVLLGGIDTRGPLWTTLKATVGRGPGGPKLIKSEKMAVKNVWQ
jgi:hypothetical protein